MNSSSPSLNQPLSPRNLSKSELQCGFHDILKFNPRLQLLVDSWREIHEEFVASRDKLATVNWGAAGETDTGYFGELTVAEHDGYWKNIPLYGSGHEYKQTLINAPGQTRQDLGYMAEHKENCQLLSKLVTTARKANCYRRVGINLLNAGEQIDRHTDNDPNPPDGLLMRVLWGLDVPTDGRAILALHNPMTGKLEHRQFKNNEFICFWGSQYHAVYNTLKSPRYVLVLDHEIRTDF